MRPFWHPLSAVLLADPRSFASTFIVRRLLTKGIPVPLVYAGDRMWPCLRHGHQMTATQTKGLALEAGMIVLVTERGILDVLRVVYTTDDRVGLAGDSDPTGISWVKMKEVVGLIAVGDGAAEMSRVPKHHAPRLSAFRAPRILRRVLLDHQEAWLHALTTEKDLAGSIRLKYDYQAPFYQHSGAVDLSPSLIDRVSASLEAQGRVLVAGSGVGRECFGLAERGWSVVGIDFSPRMTMLARDEAQRRRLDVQFQLGDLLSHNEKPASLSGILFTYDVYSFIPGRRARIGLLRKMKNWLRPGGVVLLSARRSRRMYDSWILSLQWLTSQQSANREWGQSHTRWIDADGNLHRSFVHVFYDRALRREIRAAGFLHEPWIEGHSILRPIREDSTQ